MPSKVFFTKTLFIIGARFLGECLTVCKWLLCYSVMFYCCIFRANWRAVGEYHWTDKEVDDRTRFEFLWARVWLLPRDHGHLAHDQVCFILCLPFCIWSSWSYKNSTLVDLLMSCWADSFYLDSSLGLCSNLRWLLPRVLYFLPDVFFNAHNSCTLYWW